MSFDARWQQTYSFRCIKVFSAPSRCLNQCWFIVNYTLRNNSEIRIELCKVLSNEHSFENALCEKRTWRGWLCSGYIVYWMIKDVPYRSVACHEKYAVGIQIGSVPVFPYLPLLLCCMSFAVVVLHNWKPLKYHYVCQDINGCLCVIFNPEVYIYPPFNVFHCVVKSKRQLIVEQSTHWYIQDKRGRHTNEIWCWMEWMLLGISS